jgi:hypothetical protein
MLFNRGHLCEHRTVSTHSTLGSSHSTLGSTHSTLGSTQRTWLVTRLRRHMSRPAPSSDGARCGAAEDPVVLVSTPSALLLAVLTEVLVGTHRVLVSTHMVLVSTHRVLVGTHGVLVSTHMVLVSTEGVLVGTHGSADAKGCRSSRRKRSTANVCVPTTCVGNYSQCPRSTHSTPFEYSEVVVPTTCNICIYIDVYTFIHTYI